MTSDSKYQRFALKIFADFGISIAVPAVIAAVLGDWLDERYATKPMYTIILLIIAFVLTAVIIVKKAKQYRVAYERMIKSESKTKSA